MKINMSKAPDFLIEIARNMRVLGIDEPQKEVLGSVPNIPGRYSLEGIDVRICPTIVPDHSSVLQKVIVREQGKSRRRVVLVHHNARASVIQNLDPIQRLIFTVHREGVVR